MAKVENIAGGTMEACRLVIFRSGLRQMEEDVKMPRRIIHEKLGVPVPATGEVKKAANIDEEKVLDVLAEDYRVNPGLCMSRDDIKEYFNSSDAVLDDIFLSLEKKGLVKLYRSKKGIDLIKATYEGLNAAHDLEYYKWFPKWITQDRIF